MDSDESIAFQVWFSWKHTVIEKALNGAVLGTWLPHVLDFIQATYTPALSLNRWLETHAPNLLGRDKRNLEWLISGSHCAEDPFLLRLSLVVGCEVGELRPKRTKEWLAQATVLLPAFFLAYQERTKEGRFRPCLGSVIHGSLGAMVESRDWIPLQRAREYVDFLCTCLLKYSFCPEMKHVEHLLADTGKEKDIRAVASRISPALAAIQHELCGRKEKSNGRFRPY